MINKDRCLMPATDDECRKAWLTLQDKLDIVGANSSSKGHCQRIIYTYCYLKQLK